MQQLDVVDPIANILLTPGQKGILDAEYHRWKNNELSAVEFMQKLGLKKNTFYKIVKEYEKGCRAG
ncbi:hypothetical protein [Paenibacillus polymyxa]|uniref:hypothetical protein n=1 Tax=Paenibacillus polymyxa TaxID=1406 RepID=UPI00287FB286|nr:hypothetical protein [Paenibacillus polymyxa]